MRAWGIDIRAGLILVFALGLFGGPAAAQMTTTGAFSVDDSGTANFQIPIAVPPGTGEIHPALGLRYSGDVGNGLLGIGWSLDVLSAITRCARTLPQDNAWGGVKFNGDDRFCLDGQRLMVVSGSYAADSATYRTEIDGFVRVVPVGRAGAGPQSFRAQTKSGLTLEYGATTDSRIEAAGRADIQVWALSKVSDTTGNYMAMTYSKDAASGQYRPLRIDYTGNAIAGTVPYASVRLVYEARPDVILGYTLGLKSQTGVRLSKVQTYNADTLVTDYRLTYEISPATGASRLKTVVQCDGDGNCRAPISISWSGSAPQAPLLAATPSGFDGLGQDRALLQLGDITGDGLVDVVKYEPATGRLTSYVNMGNLNFAAAKVSSVPGGGEVARQVFRLVDMTRDAKPDAVIYDSASGSLVVAESAGDGTFVAPVQSAFKSAPASNSYQSIPFFIDFSDYNSDGNTDINLIIPSVCHLGTYSGSIGNTANTSWLAYGNGGGGIENLVTSPYYICNYSQRMNYRSGGENYIFSNSTVIRDLQFDDMNGDAVIDVNVYYETIPSNYYNIVDQNGSVTPQGSYCTGFVNGANGPTPPDHTAFLVPYAFATGSNIRPLTCSGVMEESVWAVPARVHSTYGQQAYFHVPQPARLPSMPVRFGIGTGNGGIQEHTRSRHIEAENVAYMRGAEDLNGDGLLDLFGINSYKSRVELAFQKLDHSLTAVGIEIGNTANRWVEIADLDGDGLSDIFTHGPGSATKIWRQQGVLADRVTGITNGIGWDVAITYASLTSPGVYEIENGGVPPGVINLAVAAPVVREVAVSNGIGGVRRTRYSYGGLKAEINGRGSLGFHRVNGLDLETGIESRREFRQDWPFTGLAVKDTVLAPSGPGGSLRMISLVERTPACLHTGNGATCSVSAGKIYFPYIAQTVEHSWDLDGTETPSLVTTNTFDRFGNPTQVTVSASDGYASTVVNAFVNDEVNWLLGRLTSSATTASAPDATP